MIVLVFFVLYILPVLLPIMFGMVFALPTLIPPLRGWNQSYWKRILTSLVFASFAILAFAFFAAYVSAEFTISVARAMNPPTINNLLIGSRDDVRRELRMRALRPRLDFQPCYLEQEKICEIANTVEIYAGEGYPPSEESMQGYLRSVGVTFLLVWIGSLLAVLRFTTKKQEKIVGA